MPAAGTAGSGLGGRGGTPATGGRAGTGGLIGSGGSSANAGGAAGTGGAVTGTGGAGTGGSAREGSAREGPAREGSAREDSAREEQGAPSREEQGAAARGTLVREAPGRAALARGETAGPAERSVAPAQRLRALARTCRVAGLTTWSSRRTPRTGSGMAPSSGLGPRGSREVPDLRLGRGRLLSERSVELGGHGRDRLLGILRRRRRHTGRHRRLPRRTRWRGLPRVHQLGHRRERQALQRVLPEPRHDEDRSQRIFVRRIDGRECRGDPRFTPWG